MECDKSNNYSTVAELALLSSRCPATYIYRHIVRWGGEFIMYAVEMGSVTIIYISSFIKIGLCI